MLERWQMYRYNPSRTTDSVDKLLGEVSSEDRVGSVGNLGVRDGQRFVIGPDSWPDLRINWCLGSAKWRKMAWRTQRDYAYSLLVWLNYLLTTDARWWDADD